MSESHTVDQGYDRNVVDSPYIPLSDSPDQPKNDIFPVN